MHLLGVLGCCADLILPPALTDGATQALCGQAVGRPLRWASPNKILNSRSSLCASPFGWQEMRSSPREAYEHGAPEGEASPQTLSPAFGLWLLDAHASPTQVGVSSFWFSNGPNHSSEF